MLYFLKFCAGHSGLKLLSLCFHLFTQLPSDLIKIIYLRLNELHHCINHILLADLFLFPLKSSLHLFNGLFKPLDFRPEPLKFVDLSLNGGREL